MVIFARGLVASVILVTVTVIAGAMAERWAAIALISISMAPAGPLCLFTFNRESQCG